MVDKMEKWMKDSWTFQQEMFKMFGKRKWDSLNGSEENLREKLVIPFEYRFGKTYLSNSRLKKITDHVENRLLKLFRDKKYNQNFDYTFINLKEKDPDKKDEGVITCVFWLQDVYGSERCVDLDGRDYESWEDFIKNNTFSKCHMIYPKYGRYHYSHTERFADIILDESVACSTRRTVKKVFDVITGIGGVAATGVLICNPVSSPLILGAATVAAVSGVYGAGSICHLADIHKYEGGLSLEESKTLLADSNRKKKIELKIKEKEELKIKKRRENEEQIKKRFDKEVCNIIEKWTKDIGIDLFDDSKFDNYIYTLEEFKEKIKETVKRCCKLEESEDLQKEKNLSLLRLCLNHIKSEDLDPLDAFFKMNWYCNSFELFYEDLIKSCYYEYFRRYHKKYDNVDKPLFFLNYYGTENIHNCVFYRSVEAFAKDIGNLNEKLSNLEQANVR